MSGEQYQIEQLLAFKQRNKFSTDIWLERGLNPSSEELCQKLTLLVNRCTQNLIEAAENGASSREFKLILKEGLASFDKKDYDTEEKEFIGDTFHELAKIVGINFGKILNTWLYGSTLGTLINLQATLNPKKVIETLSQKCEKCQINLDTEILKKEEGIPDFSWYIVQCQVCKEYSLISIGPDIKEIRFVNYTLVEQLSKEEFTEVQAKVRLEQIRHFRKQ